MKRFLSLGDARAGDLGELVALARRLEARPRRRARSPARSSACSSSIRRCARSPRCRPRRRAWAARASSSSRAPGSWKLETRDGVVMDGDAAEHVREAIPVLAGYADALAVRAFASLADLDLDLADAAIARMAALAPVPVVNLESAADHPCQALGDWKTLDELGRPAGAAASCSRGPTIPKPLPLAVPAAVAEMAARAAWSSSCCAPRPTRCRRALAARVARAAAAARRQRRRDRRSRRGDRRRPRASTPSRGPRPSATAIEAERELRAARSPTGASTSPGSRRPRRSAEVHALPAGAAQRGGRSDRVLDGAAQRGRARGPQPACGRRWRCSSACSPNPDGELERDEGRGPATDRGSGGAEARRALPRASSGRNVFVVKLGGAALEDARAGGDRSNRSAAGPARREGGRWCTAAARRPPRSPRRLGPRGQGRRPTGDRRAHARDADHRRHRSRQHRAGRGLPRLGPRRGRPHRRRRRPGRARAGGRRSRSPATTSRSTTATSATSSRSTVAARHLLEAGYLPIVARSRPTSAGRVLNVNADTSPPRSPSRSARRSCLMQDGRRRAARRVEDPRLAGAATSTSPASPSWRRAARSAAACCPRRAPSSARSPAASARVHLIPFAAPDALLVELFTNEGIGTMVVADRAGGRDAAGRARCRDARARAAARAPSRAGRLSLRVGRGDGDRRAARRLPRRAGRALRAGRRAACSSPGRARIRARRRWSSSTPTSTPCRRRPAGRSTPSRATRSTAPGRAHRRPRGSNDAKASVAAMVAAFLPRPRSTSPSPSPWRSCDGEETSGKGTAEVVAELARRGLAPAVAVVGEPTGLDVAIAQKGLPCSSSWRAATAGPRGARARARRPQRDRRSRARPGGARRSRSRSRGPPPRARDARADRGLRRHRAQRRAGRGQRRARPAHGAGRGAREPCRAARRRRLPARCVVVSDRFRPLATTPGRRSSRAARRARPAARLYGSATLSDLVYSATCRR